MGTQAQGEREGEGRGAEGGAGWRGGEGREGREGEGSRGEGRGEIRRHCSVTMIPVEPLRDTVVALRFQLSHQEILWWHQVH